MYVVCLLFYAIGGFLFVSVFVLNRPNAVDTIFIVLHPERDDDFILPSVGGASNTIKRLLFRSIVLLFLIEHQFDVVALLSVVLLRKDCSQYFF